MDTDTMLRKLLEETERPLALAEQELRAAQENVARIQAERYGLELALARHTGEPAPQPQPEPWESPAKAGDPEWLPLDRSSAIERVLAEAGQPLHRKEIVKRLHMHGRDDSLNNVSAALAYLGRNDRVKGKGRGVWAHPDHVDGPGDGGAHGGQGAASTASENSGEPREGNDPADNGVVPLSERRHDDHSHHRDPASVVAVR